MRAPVSVSRNSPGIDTGACLTGAVAADVAVCALRRFKGLRKRKPADMQARKREYLFMRFVGLGGVATELRSRFHQVRTTPVNPEENGRGLLHAVILPERDKRGHPILSNGGPLLRLGE